MVKTKLFIKYENWIDCGITYLSFQDNKIIIETTENQPIDYLISEMNFYKNNKSDNKNDNKGDKNIDNYDGNKNDNKSNNKNIDNKGDKNNDNKSNNKNIDNYDGNKCGNTNIKAEFLKFSIIIFLFGYKLEIISTIKKHKDTLLIFNSNKMVISISFINGETRNSILELIEYFNNPVNNIFDDSNENVIELKNYDNIKNLPNLELCKKFEILKKIKNVDFLKFIFISNIFDLIKLDFLFKTVRMYRNCEIQVIYFIEIVKRIERSDFFYSKLEGLFFENIIYHDKQNDDKQNDDKYNYDKYNYDKYNYDKYNYDKYFNDKYFNIRNNYSFAFSAYYFDLLLFLVKSDKYKIICFIVEHNLIEKILLLYTGDICFRIENKYPDLYFELKFFELVYEILKRKIIRENITILVSENFVQFLKKKYQEYSIARNIVFNYVYKILDTIFCGN
ncbi:hypothetical protein DMUE_1879 [Dictyocoela muelleri]|nr:hypothetical protein DMUE_1879 [Dictyocoela muelleri]